MVLNSDLQMNIPKRWGKIHEKSILIRGGQSGVGYFSILALEKMQQFHPRLIAKNIISHSCTDATVQLCKLC